MNDAKVMTLEDVRTADFVCLEVGWCEGSLAISWSK